MNKRFFIQYSLTIMLPFLSSASCPIPSYLFVSFGSILPIPPIGLILPIRSILEFGVAVCECALGRDNVYRRAQATVCCLRAPCTLAGPSAGPPGPCCAFLFFVRGRAHRLDEGPRELREDQALKVHGPQQRVGPLEAQ